MAEPSLDVHFADLSPALLRARCADSALRAADQHEPYCLELFRRAILLGDAACWSELQAQYHGLICNWLVEKLQWQSTDPQLVSALADAALARFWRSFKAPQWARAGSLGAVLAYLRTCAACTLIEEQRRRQRAAVLLEDDLLDHVAPHVQDATATEVVEEMAAAELLALVESLCNNEAERVIARLSFTLNMRPQEIAALRPDLFAAAEAVYSAKRTLLGRLRREPRLLARRAAGAAGEPPPSTRDPRS